MAVKRAKRMWGVYKAGPKECHVMATDEEDDHELEMLCECKPRIEAGEDWFLVTHNEFHGEQA